MLLRCVEPDTECECPWRFNRCTQKSTKVFTHKALSAGQYDRIYCEKAHKLKSNAGLIPNMKVAFLLVLCDPRTN